MKPEKNVPSLIVRRKRARLFLAVSTLTMTILGSALLIANLTGTAQFVSVLSDSMEPSIKKGSLAVLHSTSASEVAEGDIIAVGVNSLSDTRISRISSIENSGGGVYSYTLWADNTPLQDPWLHRTINDIQVVSWSAPVLGWVALVISNPFFVVAMLAGSVFFAYHYTVKIFEYNRRQVHARRIAEQRLENSKYGGIDDVIDFFSEHGGAVVKVGKSKPVVVGSSEELRSVADEYEESLIRKALEKQERKNGKSVVASERTESVE